MSQSGYQTILRLLLIVHSCYSVSFKGFHIVEGILAMTCLYYVRYIIFTLCFMMYTHTHTRSFIVLSLSLIQGYTAHFGKLLEYQFPLLYNEALHLIIDGK